MLQVHETSRFSRSSAPPHLLCDVSAGIICSLQRLLAAHGGGGVWRSRGAAAKAQPGGEGQGGQGDGGGARGLPVGQSCLAAVGGTVCRVGEYVGVEEGWVRV